MANIINLSTPSQGGANLRIICNIHGNESSIGYYSFSELHSTVAGDMFGSGIDCWARTGYSIGTRMLNTCSNIYIYIYDAGIITAEDKIRTPLVQVDTMRGNGADLLTIDDDVIITGNIVLN